MNEHLGSNNTAALAEHLDRQIGAMNRLRMCLEEEFQALQSRDPEVLLAITEKKSRCLDEAGHIDRLCRDLAGRDTLMSGTITRKREYLDTLTRTCRNQNETNGTLIARQKQRVDTTLRILRGNTARSEVYGPTGESDAPVNARTLIGSV